MANQTPLPTFPEPLQLLADWTCLAYSRSEHPPQSPRSTSGLYSSLSPLANLPRAPPLVQRVKSSPPQTRALFTSYLCTRAPEPDSIVVRYQHLIHAAPLRLTAAS